jgi:hypothetical protein
MSEPAAFFVRRGDEYHPTEHSRGPWSRDSLHGRILAGLMGHAVEQAYGDPSFQFARLTVDLFRMPPFAPVCVSTRPAREGNRIRVIDAAVASGGVEIARSSVVLLRRGEQPPGNVWSAPVWDAPPPEAVEPPPSRGGYPPIWDTRSVSGPSFGGAVQKRAWLRENRALIEGVDLTPFVRVAVAADFTNPFANSGDAGLNFVNADITLYLHRLPVTEWIGFESLGHESAQGVALAACRLYDVQGPIGRTVVCGVSNQHRR